MKTEKDETFYLFCLFLPLPVIILLRSLPPLSLWWNTMSDTPTNTRPTTTKLIPSHMKERIRLPRKATDRSAVKIITAPKERKCIVKQTSIDLSKYFP